MQTASRIADQMSAPAIGWSSGHDPPTLGGPPVSSRSAATSGDIGFHSAIVRGTRAMPAIGTNVPAMNVSGSITVKPTPCTASGDLNDRPRTIPAHMNANSVKRTRAIATTTSPKLMTGLQPSANPRPATTTTPSSASQNWPSTWPVSTDRRAMGSDRNRSTTPSCMSTAVAVPAPMTEKAICWAMTPGRRKSV